MARHVRHEVARRRGICPADSVQTVASLVEELTPNLEEPSPAVDRWLLDEALRRAARPELERLAEAPGLRSELAETIRALLGSGRSQAFANIATTPLERAVAAVTAAYQDLLASCGLTASAERVFRAAENAAAGASWRATALVFDGFFFLSPGEQALVAALAGQECELLVTLPAPPDPGEFEGFEWRVLAEARRPQPQPEIVRARNVQREVEEVARQILEANRPLGEIGVVLRSPQVYASLLQATFERFGLPFRMRRPAPLAERPEVRCLRELLAAAAESFPAEATLEALRRPCSRVGRLPELERWDSAVRAALPGEGLPFLREEAPEPVAQELDRIAEIAAWVEEPASAGEWARRFRRLRSRLAPPDAPDGLAPERLLELRRHGETLRAFDAACDEAARLLELRGAAAASFDDAVRALDAALEDAVVDAPDDRRDVIQVLSAYEARQWELPVVFVCGLVEGRFPQRPAENPFFSDQDLKHLRRQGLPLRTAADRAREEELLFEIAASRATERLVLTYPEEDALGAPQLRSFLLPPIVEDEAQARSTRPAEPSPTAVQASPAIVDWALLEHVRQAHAQVSPSSLQDFLQCPYMFFAKRTLRLEQPPERPADRLNPLLRGIIVHSAVSAWSRDRRAPISPLLEEIFDDTLRQQRIPPSFATAIVLAAMTADLERFAASMRGLPRPAGLEQEFERQVEFAIELDEDEVRVGGRIDRFDRLGSWAVVIDYKNSNPNRLKSLLKELEGGRGVQLPLYLRGLERSRGLRPGGMIYWALRKDCQAGGWVAEESGLAESFPQSVEVWSPSQIDATLDQTQAQARRAIDGIRRGDIRVEPYSTEPCNRFCEYRDLCRIELSR